MCCEDLKIDWEKIARVQVFSMLTTSQQILGVDPFRWGIIIGPADGGTNWFMPGGPAVLNQGFGFPIGQVPTFFNRYNSGDLVGQAWFGLNSAAGHFATIVEILMPTGGVCGDYRFKGASQLFGGSG